MTPLAFACMVGDLPLVAYVGTHGGAADVTQADYGGWTPLLRAARQGSVDVVAWLCSHGALEDLRRPNVQGGTPLGEAARMGHLRVVQVNGEGYRGYARPEATSFPSRIDCFSRRVRWRPWFQLLLSPSMHGGAVLSCARARGALNSPFVCCVWV